MAMSGGKDDGSPMMEMNTTPLIDVMLVLLIMFIITIPVATHAVNIDLPSPQPTPPQTIVEPVKNKVVLTTDNQVLWNGNPINNGQLVTLLQESMKLPTEPELQFEPEANASYDLSARVLNIIKGSGVTKFGFVGNERYASFAKEPGA
ncbi:biopolymer transport protein ExbD [Caenibius tardaugens NBRC 16725]|uniref:Biopolymer transport protein ExbD n=1 Tax=Caenibius tardaugens NBRC 16725 TaxID=1219035 RepID=U2ZUH3_9SPHN|nr:biopolymer transporter ExbD [Caenibius tardaugens]AZI35921.1 biopolymer transporter ExbD [Caenibius tardaugens NBRC 16725]GAD49029.1 biopolymer transport protein ExbD [Caenibius tardaugens NBRC 16725]